METAKPDPRVGVAAIVYGPDGRVVFGRRKSSHGAGMLQPTPLAGRVDHIAVGQWAFPGGHLEFGEEISSCAEREVLEETGLQVKGVKLAAVTNSVWHDPDRHYITLFMICEMLEPEQQPQVSELASDH